LLVSYFCEVTDFIILMPKGAHADLQAKKKKKKKKNREKKKKKETKKKKIN